MLEGTVTWKRGLRGGSGVVFQDVFVCIFFPW